MQEPTAVTLVEVVGPTSLQAGETAQLDATARDAEGDEVEAASFRWESSDPSVATVSETGLVTAIATSEVAVRAVADGVAGSLTLTVVAPLPPPPPGTATVVVGEDCSIIGGYVYRGAAVPQLQGHYFYSDFCAGWVRSIRVEGGTVVDQREWPELRPGAQVLSLGEDSAGEVYLLARDGGVFRIVPR